MKILLTGATGMLGGYLLPMLKEDNEVNTLQRHSADIICDLTSTIPDFDENSFDLVVHAAGSTDDDTALELNLEGTRRLLQGLEKNPPKELVYLSSWEVYSPDSGENVTEEHQTWASTKVGQSKARAEQYVKEWCDQRNVTLTILRPARMFGTGVHGEMKRMFNDVVNSRYIHVRGNDACLSLVCAVDVAEAVKRLHSIGGIYNLSDGKGATWIALAEAMSANSGAMKRQTFLPKKWAETAWKLTSWIPAVRASLSPEILAVRSKTLTLSDFKIRDMLQGWNPYPTIEVINRQCESYPYSED
ncbi:MAG: NAD(P)-dependent oxidoreductase [Muribaculaceae bacterium]|nr:NAD(P)-dependent oxidoreductase [Muribaculaceae bacterium]